MNITEEKYKKVLADKDAYIERLKKENEKLKKKIQELNLNQSSTLVKQEDDDDYYLYNEDPPYGCGGY